MRDCECQEEEWVVLMERSHGTGKFSHIYVGRVNPKMTHHAEQMNRARGLPQPVCKTYHKAIGAKPVWWWYKSQHTDIRNRMENPEMNLHTNSKIILDKSAKNVHWRKDGLFNQRWLKNWMSTFKRSCPSPTTHKSQMKGLPDVKLKLWLKNTGETHQDICLNPQSPSNKSTDRQMRLS
jgi:hypothetical protein